MSLVVEVSVGSNIIRTMEMTRRGPYPPKSEQTDDSVYRYAVRVDDEFCGHVGHRYGDDALTLILKSIVLYRRISRHGELPPEEWELDEDQS